MQKSLDQKLANIHADPSGAKDFILADAKDADMAFGIGAPGKSPESHAGEVTVRTLAEYRTQIRQIVQQGVVDIMLMSASTNDVLTYQEGLFQNSHITPAARANDASDVFVVRGGKYLDQPARPFRSATLDHIQCGHVDCTTDERSRGTNLGLYSVTFNNRLDDDLETLNSYRSFRTEAEAKGFRHFLEVFDPNAPHGLPSEMTPAFINDQIARTLAGVAPAGRPVFLKIVYHGPKSMEELVRYDPHLIVGILGGSAGTTYDAFKQVAEAQKYGARAALYGRKINQAECQLAFVQLLRMIVEHQLKPEEAVRVYHGVLEKLKIKPQRSLADDMELRTGTMSYASSSVAVPAGMPHSSNSKPIKPSILAGPSTMNGDKHDCGCHAAVAAPCACKHSQTTSVDASRATHKANGKPDFAKMTNAEKLTWNKAERDRVFGVIS